MVYQVSRDGQLYGPYTVEDLRRYLASGNILPTDLARGEDMTEWVPVLQALNPMQQPPPPLPAFAQPAPWSSQPAYGCPVAAVPTIPFYPLFPVSTAKFVVMSLCTLGLYQVYWAYKNWDRINTQSGEGLMPWARAIFLGIFNFSLFGRVRSRALNEEISVGWSPVFLGVVVLVLAVCSRLPRGVAALSLLSFLPYLPVVATISQLNAKAAAFTEERPNDGFSALNIVGIVLGGILLLLALIGLLSDAFGLAS